MRSYFDVAFRRSRTALVIDSCSERRRLLEILIENNGIAANGSESLKTALSEYSPRYDFIIAEVDDPELDGRHLIQSLRACGFSSHYTATVDDPSPKMMMRLSRIGFQNCVLKTKLYDIEKIIKSDT